MPGVTLPAPPRHIAPPTTEENLDWADLAIIDLSKYHTTEGRAKLVVDLRNALSTAGFFYVINHGYTQDQTDRIFDIADIPFTHVEDAEKKTYISQVKDTGSYQGYKMRQYWHIDNGVRDQIESYNIHPQVTRKQHPEALRPYLPEIEAFAKHNHFDILFPLLRLLAIGLELPEETFVDQHKWDAEHDAWVRFAKYYPRSEDDELKAKNVWLKGHTDFGSLTLLWSQPVAALQILTEDGGWKWVKHINNALVVNTGESLEFLSGGVYKGTIHRVVQPPVDQRTLTRLSAFYFALPNDEVVLAPMKQSPVLQRLGITRRFEDDKAPTMETWRKGRASKYGQTTLQEGQQRGVEEEMINGILVKHYN